jgi:hypothetical protein
VREKRSLFHLLSILVQGQIGGLPGWLGLCFEGGTPLLRSACPCSTRSLASSLSAPPATTSSALACPL